MAEVYDSGPCINNSCRSAKQYVDDDRGTPPAGSPSPPTDRTVTYPEVDVRKMRYSSSVSNSRYLAVTTRLMVSPSLSVSITCVCFRNVHTGCTIRRATDEPPGAIVPNFTTARLIIYLLLHHRHSRLLGKCIA